MTNVEFIEETSKMERYYDKEYTQEQLHHMYEELKAMNIERYRAVIKNVFRQCRFLPKLVEILNINEETHINKTETENKTKCSKCNGKGYLLYTKKVNNGDKWLEYTYIANCECRKEKSYCGWEITDTNHRSNYYEPSAKKLGLI